MSNADPFVSSAKLALSIRQLRSRMDADLLASEPIAVIGMGCRFPGGIESPGDYWQFLLRGGEAVTEIPASRWDAAAYFDPDLSAAGKMNGRWGAFLEAPDLFDPGYFGISPREAAEMDPQQRLALEVVWEAIHDSGTAPGAMAGTRTGVFAAAYNTDYSRLLLARAESIGPHTCAGAAQSMVTGRVSFLLDLHGPSVTVDAACSSSLVAIHLAVQSLRTRDCDAAIAGGVSLKFSPEYYVCLSKLAMLSPDGRCHTFDAAANGFVPGEGCGFVVLKRLADALAAGDRIRAVVRGTAAGQDGRTNSLTAPNGIAQRELIRAAVANARISPGDIGYVETHGTGTALGDPIEVEALAGAIGEGSRPCVLGAAKTNFGHLEAAAGVAGFIKAALVVESGEIPPNVGYRSLNPHISLEGTRFRIPTERQPWERGDCPRLAGVSSFGFTGTNAHLILEEPPRVPAPREDDAGGPYMLLLSARTPAALEAAAARYAGFLADFGRGYSAVEICRNAALRRDLHEERLAAIGATHEELRARLADAPRGRAALDPGTVAFVFSGQGSQWPAMGTALMRREPVFAAAIENCDAAIQKLAGWRLKQALAAEAADSLLHRTEYAQPAIFAVQTALAGLLQSWGVRPAAVLGHSVGEVAAAHAAGVLDLHEAIRIVLHRGRLMDAATGHGRMLSIALPAEAAASEIAWAGERVSVAAINSPVSTVISGDPEAVEEIAKRLGARGISCRMLPVDYAFHSSQMETFREALPRALGRVETRPAALALVSTVTGTLAAAGDYSADYWGRNVREPVRFADAIACAAARGVRCFIEVSPHAVLTGSIAECAPEAASVATLRRNRDERGSLLAAAGQLFTLGHTLEWKRVLGPSRTVVPLPAYPYQRQRYWVQEKPITPPAATPVQTLPGEPLHSPALRGKVWQAAAGASHPLIRGHRVAGRAVFPLAGYVEAAASACGVPLRIEDFELGEALLLPEDGETPLQTVLEGSHFEIHSLTEGVWKRHAAGRVSALQGTPKAPAAATGLLPALDPARYYGAMAESGLEYGPEYRTIRELRAGEDSSQAVVELETDADGCLIAPALLDGCLQTVLAARGTMDLHLPQRLARFDLFRPAGRAVRCAMRVVSTAAESFTADFDLTDADGTPVACGRGLVMKRIRGAQTAYELRWQKRARAATARTGGPGTWLILSSDGKAAGAVSAALRRRGAEAVVSAVPAEGAYRGVLYLAAPDTREDAYVAVLPLIQGAGAAELWIATRNSQRVAPQDQVNGWEQAAVWGLARTAALEYPDQRFVRVDLDGTEEALAALVEEMLAAEDGSDLAFRGRDRYAASLVRMPAVEAPEPVRLVPRTRGSIDGLAWEPVSRRATGRGQIEVEVQASALNFRDVLNVLGAYPGDPGPLGLEFCGRVLSAGEGVADFRPGDLVMGLGWGCFSDVFVADAAMTVRVPEGMEPEAAVTLPNAYATACHSLVTVAGIRENDRVLIHAAAGGVGMMAVRIAQNAGAEVYATAGTPEKRAFLRSMGVRHVFDSRTLGFAGQVLEATGGRGVDVALNSLAGEFIPATLSAMARGGRFVEIGKTGIWDAERVAALGRDIQYRVVDLGVFLDREPDVIGGYLRRLSGEVRSGTIAPLPCRVFDFAKAGEAFRWMAQARHTGKLVLRHAAAGRGFRTGGTWLLTGGFGALGLEMAGWLACRGAERLVLAGRSPAAGETLARIAEIERSGIRVDTCLADASDREQLRVAIENAGPLRGIVHLAGTVDDGVLAAQTSERFEAVFGPKARGALHLHELAGEDLRHFILFSSAAAVLGSPAQGNYAAANAVLDGLANRRAALGLPSLSVNWGAWADKGMAARAEASGRRTMSLLRPVKPAEFLAALDGALASGRSNLALMQASWTEWNALPGRSRVEVAAAPERAGTGARVAAGESIADQLAGLPVSRRRKTAVDFLRAHVLRIVGLPESHPLREDEPLLRIGLDSLMALELRNTLARAFRRQLPSTLLFDCPSLGALGDYFVPAEAPRDSKPAVDEAMEEISAMSDSEAEELLAKELGEAVGGS